MKLFRAALAASIIVAVGACGSGGSEDDSGAPAASREPTRTVDVEMVDHKFNPAELSVAKGEIVKFRFTNKGSVDHEAFIGDAQAQLAYAKEVADLKESHEGAGAHDDAGAEHDHPDGAVHVKPGESAELTHTFDKAEEVEIACYEPGHLEAGMRTTIKVA